MLTLDSDVRFIKGIGPKKAELLYKLGIFTLDDAINYYPRAYDDRRNFKNIATLTDGDLCCFTATVATMASTRRLRKGLEVSKLSVFDGSGHINLTFFNSKFAAENLKLGKEYNFFGKITGAGYAKTSVNPQYEDISKNVITNCIVPIYPLTSSLTRRDICTVIDAALAVIGENYKDFIPDNILKQYSLPSLASSIYSIHHPDNDFMLEKAKNRLIFSEFFVLSLGLNLLREKRSESRGIHFENLDASPFINSLAFKLTNAQQSAINDSVSDLEKGISLNRLIQGDVGSGKTAIASAMAYIAAINGYQTALMAPTEILAKQHFDSLRPLFAKFNIECILLTSSLKAKEKREALARISENANSLVIGTHALIEDKVIFAKLGLIIADEQHRFGVAQRSKLSLKSDNPHVMVMSATPIPRTLALMIYSDMDISIVNELPPGRTPVKTYGVGENMRKRIYAFIEKHCKMGNQCYIVCPMVEESEDDDGLKSVTAYAKKLKETEFSKYNLEFIHGKMKSSDKNRIMSDFTNGDIDILVSTTVIEVGVNVPNASLMVVENAERFGLAALHQLRGRVGRGSKESFCILFGADKGEKAKERIDIMCNTNDGFVISEHDLKLRGPGDFFGNRQHGMPDFKIADLSQDIDVLQNAKLAATELLDIDPNLNSYPILNKKIQLLFENNSI